jgi:hypothetical protein
MEDRRMTTEIRVIGTEDGCQSTLDQLAALFNVHEVRGPYPCCRRADNSDAISPGKPVPYYAYADVTPRRVQHEPGA